MKSVDEYAAAYRETVQREIPDEQVLAVGILSRPGSLGNALLSQFSGIAALARNSAGKKASADLPQNVVVAVTPTRVLCFDFKPKMTSIKLKGCVRAMPRQGLHVTAAATSLATRVTFSYPDGSGFELDSNRNIGQYQRLNDGLLHALGAVAAVS